MTAPEGSRSDPSEESESKSPSIVQVIGPSDSGKTTLIEALVDRLAEHGRVATVKSIHHDVEFDTPGKDTHRHRAAGAETVVGVTPSTTFRIRERGKADPPREIDRLEEILDHLAREGYDVVLVEGFKAASLPSIVLGEASLVDDRTIAAGDSPDEINLPAVVEAILERTGAVNQ